MKMHGKYFEIYGEIFFEDLWFWVTLFYIELFPWYQMVEIGNIGGKLCNYLFLGISLSADIFIIESKIIFFCHKLLLIKGSKIIFFSVINYSLWQPSNYRKTYTVWDHACIKSLFLRWVAWLFDVSWCSAKQYVIS